MIIKYITRGMTWHYAELVYNYVQFTLAIAARWQQYCKVMVHVYTINNRLS